MTTREQEKPGEAPPAEPPPADVDGEVLPLQKPLDPAGPTAPPPSDPVASPPPEAEERPGKCGHTTTRGTLCKAGALKGGDRCRQHGGKRKKKSKRVRGRTSKADAFQSKEEKEAAVKKGEAMVQSIVITEGGVDIEIPVPGTTREIWELINQTMVITHPEVWKDLDTPLPKLPGAKRPTRGTQMDMIVLAYDKMLIKWLPWILDFGPEVLFALANLMIITPRAHAVIEAYLNSRKKRLRKVKSDGGDDEPDAPDVPGGP